AVADMAAVQRWLDAYVAAGRSNDRAEITALFTEDAVYRPLPYDQPLRGGEAIARAWIADPDPPGRWTADYQAVAATGEVGVGRGGAPPGAHHRRGHTRLGKAPAEGRDDPAAVDARQDGEHLLQSWNAPQETRDQALDHKHVDQARPDRAGDTAEKHGEHQPESGPGRQDQPGGADCPQDVRQRRK